MKLFRYRFTKLIYILIAAGMAACVAGFAVTLWQCITQGTEMASAPSFTIVRYVLLFFVTVVLFAILLSLLVASYYKVDGTALKTKFGFISSSYDLMNAENITLDRKTGKLTLTFGDGAFIVIVIKERLYEDFVQAVLDINRSVEYTIISKTGEDDKKN